MNLTSAELVRSVVLVPRTMDQSDDVTQLLPSDGGDYVYALTAQQVNYILYMNSIKLAIKHVATKKKNQGCLPSGGAMSNNHCLLR